MGGGVCGQGIFYHVAAFRDSLKFEIQHDHVLKKLNFDLLTPRVSEDKGKGGGGLQAKYLLPCCYIL